LKKASGVNIFDYGQTIELPYRNDWDQEKIEKLNQKKEKIPKLLQVFLSFLFFLFFFIKFIEFPQKKLKFIEFPQKKLFFFIKNISKFPSFFFFLGL